jgi:hypothetical protein
MISLRHNGAVERIAEAEARASDCPAKPVDRNRIPSIIRIRLRKKK